MRAPKHCGKDSGSSGTKIPLKKNLITNANPLHTSGETAAVAEAGAAAGGPLAPTGPRWALNPASSCSQAGGGGNHQVFIPT